MDKTQQMEIVMEGLKGLKTDQSNFNSIRESAKLFVGKYPELQKDKEIQALLLYSIGTIGSDKVGTILTKHFAPKQNRFSAIAGLTDGMNKTQNLDFLFLTLYAQVERAGLAHKVYVLARSDIRDNVEFPNKDKKDELTEDGVAPKHRTLSVTLWDADVKKIISLFLVDGQVDSHASLETGKSYKMQIGYYSEEKKRWYASKDPSVTPLDGFKLDEMELAKYLIDNYPQIKEPYSDAVADLKENPGKRYVLYAQYVKDVNYISLLPSEGGEPIMMRYGKLTSVLDDQGEVIVLGNIQKVKPFEGQSQPTTIDYVIYPDIVIPSDVKEEKASSTVHNVSDGGRKSVNENKEKDPDMDELLG